MPWDRTAGTAFDLPVTLQPRWTLVAMETCSTFDVLIKNGGGIGANVLNNQKAIDVSIKPCV